MQTAMLQQRPGVGARPHRRQLASRRAAQLRTVAQATTLVAPPAKGDLKTSDPKQAELSIK